MSKLPITMAIGPYEHMRDLATGRVMIEGVDLNFLDLPTLEIFHRFTHNREFDVSEMSFGRYIALFSQDESIIALPVFPSRMFRLAAIFVRDDGSIKSPADLAGKNIGVPEWAQTATIYLRGWLQHTAGVPLESVNWFTGGTHDPQDRAEQVPIALPPGIKVTPISDRGLPALLLDGTIDAIFSAGPPRQFRKPNSGIVRLFPDYQAAEEDYYRATGIFPIMHIICMRREIAEANPWLPMNLLKAFEQSKNNSIERLTHAGMSRYAMPWLGNHYAARIVELFGQDFWPYGVAANRKTLDAFAQYAYEHGVCKRKLTGEDLFEPRARDLGTSYGQH